MSIDANIGCHLLVWYTAGVQYCQSRVYVNDPTVGISDTTRTQSLAVSSMQSKDFAFVHHAEVILRGHPITTNTTCRIESPRIRGRTVFTAPFA